MSTPLSTRSSCSITRCAPAHELKSATIPSTCASETAFRISAAAPSTHSGVCPLIHTRAPSAASERAIASPIPAVEPVTSAVFPPSFKSIPFLRQSVSLSRRRDKR